MAVDGLGQGDGVETVAELPQVAEHGGRHVGTGLETLQRRAGWVVVTTQAGAHPFLAQQLHGRQEEVVEPGQVLLVERGTAR